MVLIERVIKIVFTIQTNRTVTQIRNYLINTLFPEWRIRLGTAFAGYVSGTPTVMVENSNSITLVPGFTGRYEVYPMFCLSLEVPTGTGADAQTRFQTFIDDVKEWTRVELATLGTTQVLSIHWHKADGTSGDTTF